MGIEKAMNGGDGDPPSDKAEISVTVDAAADPGPVESFAGMTDVEGKAPASAVQALWRRPPARILGAVFLVLLVVVGVYLAKRQLDRHPPPIEAPPPAADNSPAATFDFPPPAETPLAGGGPPPGKILNSANDDLKAAAKRVERAQPPLDGASGGLPAPSNAGAISGNAGMQDAAKEAAKLLSPGKIETSEIDLSTDDSAAALQSLERAAAEQALRETAPAATVPSRDRAAGDDAGPIQSLETERQHPDHQAAEIERLTAEISALRSQGSPVARQAAAALAFGELAIKARAGEPYARELNAYLRLAGPPVASAIAGSADRGMPTLADLKEAFPAMRNAALAAARREGAAGPLARLGVNFAALVNLRPAGPVPGAGPPAVFARAEANLMADDLAGALSELDGLTGAARAKAADWVGEARRRADGETALAALNRDLLALMSAERGAQ